MPAPTEESRSQNTVWQNELLLMRMFTVDLVLQSAIAAEKSKKRMKNLELTRSAYAVALREFILPSSHQVMLSRMQSYDNAVKSSVAARSESEVERAVASRLVSFVANGNQGPPEIAEAMNEFSSFFDLLMFVLKFIKFK